MARLHPTAASTGVLPGTGSSLARSRRHAVVVHGIFFGTSSVQRRCRLRLPANSWCSGACSVKADNEARPVFSRQRS
jgi:hypothetical protein